MMAVTTTPSVPLQLPGFIVVNLFIKWPFASLQWEVPQSQSGEFSMQEITGNMPATQTISPLPARLDDYLAMNVAPLDIERTSFQSLLEDRRLRRAGLVSQTAAIQLQLQRLAQQTEDTDDQIVRLTTVLAPIRRIPNEILCEIFVWAAKHHRATRLRNRAP
ncbi:hypothetical protein C8F01DRAFT_662360 [Mycena amicta]|nr:hypothetical protein C8F01DRAFT_662360 [Mycena amicta]